MNADIDAYVYDNIDILVLVLCSYCINMYIDIINIYIDTNVEY